MGRVPPGRVPALTGAGPSPAASWPLCLFPLAVPSGWQPRTQTPRRPCRDSGRLCSCGAAGGPARQPGAAGTSPPTPPTPASHSRSPRAAAPTVSASLCSSTAPTASATPSASMSSRQDAPSARGLGLGAVSRGGAGRPLRGRVSTQMAGRGTEAWTRSFGRVGQAGPSGARLISRFHQGRDTLGVTAQALPCPLAWLRTTVSRGHFSPEDPVVSWGLICRTPAATPKLCNLSPHPVPLRLLLGQGRPLRARKK